MTRVKLISAWFGGALLLAGIVGILESGAADVFLEATRPDFQKISLGVAGIQNGGGPDWLGGRIEEVLKKDVKRSLVFDLVDLPSLGIATPDIGNGTGNGSKAVFKQAAEKGVSVLVGEKPP
jgi:hypothetical protein